MSVRRDAGPPPPGGFATSPPRLAALYMGLCLGMGGLAVGQRPHDALAWWAAGVAVALGGVFGVAALRGWVEPRGVDTSPARFPRWLLVVIALEYGLAFAIFGHQHGYFPRATIGFDALIATLLLLGLLRRRARRTRSGPDAHAWK